MKAIEINFDSLIAETYKPIDLTKMHNVKLGGRASTKSSCNALTIAFLMNVFKDMEAVVIRQDMVHHRDSTLKELIIAFERLGMVEGVHFIVKYTPMMIELIETKQRIRFGAMNDYNKLKGYKPSNKNKYFGVIWLFEFAEFKNSEGIEQVISTFVRGAGERQFNTFQEANPPNDPFSWVYDYIEKIKDNDDYDYSFKTYLDLTEDEQYNWLGQKMLNVIENLKVMDKEQYNHIYLGEMMTPSGKIYKRFNQEFIKTIPYEEFRLFQMGIDYGESDATTAVLLGFKGANYMHALSQYYHRNSKSEYDINDYAREVDDYIRRECKAIREATNRQVVIEVYIDSASLSFYNLMKQESEQNERMYIVKKVDKRPTDDKKSDNDKYNPKKPKAIQERIDFFNLMLGALRVSVDPSCKMLIKELNEAKYDENNNRLDNQKYRVDSLDAMEYGFKNHLAKIREYVLKKGVLNEDVS